MLLVCLAIGWSCNELVVVAYACKWSCEQLLSVFVSLLLLVALVRVVILWSGSV